MAVIKKRVVKKKGAVKKPVQNENRKKVHLSKKKFKPSDNLEDYNILIYGQRKVGKTTLAGEMNNPYFFMFEPNESYEFYKSDVDNWEDFLDLVNEFSKGDHNFGRAVIDTVRPCFNTCMDYTCKKFGFDHPGSQNDYGASWSKVRKEFEIPIRKLMINSKFGFIALAHEIDKEITTRSGATFYQVAPDLPATASKLIGNEVHNIFYYFIENGKRWLQIAGDEYICAGHRMRGRFLTTSGDRIFKIPMGNSETEAWKNLQNAFNNKQKNSYEPKKKKGVVKKS